jgi:hypothetical protein
MDTRDVKAEFIGFGPIPSSSPTFAQGIGMGGSFAPISAPQISFLPPSKRQNKIQIYSSGEDDGQQFRVEVDHNTETALVYLGNTGLTEYLQLQTDTSVGESSIYGYSGNGAQNFQLSANDTDGKTKLALFNEESAEYLEIKIDGDSPESTIYGYADSESEYYFLKAKPGDTQLFLYGGEGSVKIDIPDNAGTPLNAYWQEIDVCVDGVAKKMQVLGTEPYDPPTP